MVLLVVVLMLRGRITFAASDERSMLWLLRLGLPRGLLLLRLRRLLRLRGTTHCDAVATRTIAAETIRLLLLGLTVSASTVHGGLLLLLLLLLLLVSALKGFRLTIKLGHGLRT